MRKRNHKLILLKNISNLALLALFFLASGIAINAATFTVINTNDSGTGSLRQAVLGANFSIEDDTIVFAEPYFNTPRTINLTSGELEIIGNGKLTISGPGAHLLTVSTDNADWVFVVRDGGDAEINKLTVSNSSGTGIFVETERFFPEPTTSLIVNNIVVSNCAGTGISVWGRDSELVVRNSTISNNSSGISGWEVEKFMTIINSTISGNYRFGGVSGTNAAFRIYNSTITNNTYESGGSLFGGGINAHDKSIFLRNTIVAGNTSVSNPGKSDVASTGIGFIYSAGYNLIGKQDGSSYSGDPDTDQIGTVAAPIDPLLGPLQDNGGTSGITPTHELLCYSPAIDAGSNEQVDDPPHDQRGFSRPFDDPDIPNVIGENAAVLDGIDIGAFERQERCNTPPMLTPSAVSVSADSSSTESIAAVSDTEDSDEDLTLTINGGTSALSNGVTVSDPAINSSGIATANISAVCSATDAVFDLEVTDSGGLTATGVLNISVTPETEAPVIGTVSDVSATLPQNNDTSMVVNFPTPTAGDNCDANVSVTLSPASGSDFPVGETIVTVDAVDDAGNLASTSFKVTVLYPFDGFYAPIKNDQATKIGAGTRIRIGFSLGGFRGQDIYASGSPASQRIDCSTGLPIGSPEPIEGRYIENPMYNQRVKTYTSFWNTDRSWRGQCRRLQVRLNDGSIHTADFNFR